MTRFIPAFFQRRLLRFIVSKIDLIDADAFDLDSLELSWGVWELKDVPLRIDKVRDRIPLPPGVELEHAGVRLIRIILPGDIYAANLAIEVSGVEIKATIRELGGNDQVSSTSSPRTAAKRTRMGYTQLHDPGGRTESGGSGLENLIPTSEDIAQSFLQAEPEEEIQELESTVASQSQEFQHPDTPETESPSTEELGVGAATSLPTFMTDMVKGFLDRLQLHVADIAVQVTFESARKPPPRVEEGSGVEPVRFLFQVSDVRLDAIDNTLGSEDARFGKRKFSVQDVRLSLLGETEGSFRTSTASGVSSPAFHSRSPTAPSSGASDLRSEVSDMSSSPNISRVASWEPAESRYQDMFMSGFSGTDQEVVVANELQESDSEDDAENAASILARRGHLRRRSEASRGSLQDSQYSDAPLPNDDEDPDELAKSKLFTHDDAQSMYMSAMSAATTKTVPEPAMPGAWSVYQSARQGLGETSSEQPSKDRTIPQNEVARSSTTSTSSTPSIKHGRGLGLKLETSETNTTESTPGMSTSSTAEEPSTTATGQPFVGTIVVRDIFIVDILILWLPSPFERRSSLVAETDPPPASVPPQAPTVRFSKLPLESPLDASTTSVAASMYHKPLPPRTIATEQETLEIEISTVRVDFDISIAKLLISLSQIIRPEPHDEKSAPTQGETLRLPVKGSLGSFDINLLERVPASILTEAHGSDRQRIESASDNVRELLIGMRFGGMALMVVPTTQQIESRLNISRCNFAHASGTILSFAEQTDSRGIGPRSIPPASSISIITVSSSTLVHIDAKAPPMRLSVDIRAIEDILNKAGGLSSLLELGGSITSVSTVKFSPSHTTTTRRSRAVHFQHERLPQTKSVTKSIKINVRLSGAALDLVGSDCSLKLSTSSVKMVHRAEGFGLQIDRAELTGPFHHSEHAMSPLTITVRNIRLELLDTPKEVDIDRLLRLITPSKDKYDEDDDIMLETLLRQRSKGAVLRLTLGNLDASLEDIDAMKAFSTLSTDLSRLSGVTKYLPEDDRPGILSLILIKDTNIKASIDERIGDLQGVITTLEIAYINLPSLTALQAGSFSVKRNSSEVLLGPVLKNQHAETPMLMCRFIAGEMEPTVRLKLSNVLVEYRVPTLVSLLGLEEAITEEDLALGLAASFADLQAMDVPRVADPPSPSSSDSRSSDPILKGVRVDIGLRDLVIGLNPTPGVSKGLVCLTAANITAATPRIAEFAVELNVKKASILVIDDYRTIGDSPTTLAVPGGTKADTISCFASAGYVVIGDLSSASAKVKSSRSPGAKTGVLDVELRDDLFILETCADSTQTLIGLLDGLKPPAPVSKIAKYRTEIVPLQDMLASFSGDAFVSEAGPEKGVRTQAEPESEDSGSDDANQDLEYFSEFYEEPPLDESREELAESSNYFGLHGLEGSSHSTLEASQHSDSAITIDAEPSPDEMIASALHFQDDYFARNSGPTVPTHHDLREPDTHNKAQDQRFEDFPVKVRVRDVHFIWNLYDGYDWQRTRETITQAVKDIEDRAASKRGHANSGLSPEPEEEEEPVIDDFLFNSIYIGVPAHRDPTELAANINRGINDDVSETGSYATSTTTTSSPSRQSQPSRTKSKRLKLSRSKHHKMTFELSGVSADVLVFPPESGEVQSSVDVRIKDLVIFDHVPTSTWRRFATYMQDVGERETGTSMIHLEILNVKPVPDLAATEMILKVDVLPIRLHVDQDALDFMTRFFEFKDDTAQAPSSPSNPPFIQRAEVNPVRIRLDFKPKRVDYGGLRSGRTTEFMNFFILDQADMVLRRVILYGVSGFDRLGIMLNNIWTPDVKRNQLPGILAGLAPIRSLVNVGSGVKDLVVLPVREYKKDGRVVRSIQKGAMAFAKTTTSELVKLGAKLALGTQTVLQNTETLLGQGDGSRAAERLSEESDEEESGTKKQISLYADQPIGVVQGLRGAYASLERDLLLARDAIVAVPGEVMESGSAGGAAKAVLKKAPTVILRPAIGATKAVGQTLLGAGNTLDRENYRRMEEKYKRH